MQRTKHSKEILKNKIEGLNLAEVSTSYKITVIKILRSLYRDR